MLDIKTSFKYFEFKIPLKNFLAIEIFHKTNKKIVTMKVTCKI